jgi:hypothetical protein
MKIFDSIQLGNSGPACQNCAWFQNDPSVIEVTYRGLSSLSSGFASVRDRDGFCLLNQLYLSGLDHCPHHLPHTTDE